MSGGPRFLDEDEPTPSLDVGPLPPSELPVPRGPVLLDAMPGAPDRLNVE